MPKIVDHAARRAEIVHGLWLVIYTRGIDSVTFRSVAESAGISIGRVQHYFSSREELVLEGCRQLVAGAELDDEAGGPSEDADPVAALRDFLHAFIPEGEAMRMGASVWFTYIAKAVGDANIAEVVVDNDHKTAEAARRRVRAVSDAVDSSESAPSSGLTPSSGSSDSRGDDASAPEVSSGRSARDIDVAARVVALAKGLAQDVMLESRSPESAYRILDDEVSRIVADAAAGS
ncbi:hypothetical protein KACC15558_20520 [Brevibacterium ammoniilyticum]|uniref:HTH tetR-type domain-containing protein n=1 Tax=Brevibacterium ammoniilyticum TaxID=1046555 RepID=A0ABP9U063_9MICO